MANRMEMVDNEDGTCTLTIELGDFNQTSILPMNLQDFMATMLDLAGQETVDKVAQNLAPVTVPNSPEG